MKKLLLTIFCAVLCSSIITAQNCTTALTPNITAVLETVADFGNGNEPAIQVTFDPQCAARTAGAGDGCDLGDNNSLVWYVGFYGQNAPSPNGLLSECAVSTTESIMDTDPNCAIGNNTLPVSNGGDFFAQCLAPKGSTCTSQEFSQRRGPGGGEIHSWWTTGTDGAGNLGICDGVPGFDLTLPACPGQCYNVIMWEFIINQPGNTGPSAPLGGSGTNLPFPGFDTNLACGTINLIDESAPTPIFQFCMSGANAMIDIPTITVTSDNPTCGAVATTIFTGSYQGQPEDASDDNDTCDSQAIDVQIQIDEADGSIDGTIGAIGSGDAGDLSIGFVGTGGNSANAALNLGNHVVEVNCRENVTIQFSTPVGCEGTDDGSIFGFPLCSFATSFNYTSAKIFLYANGMPISSSQTDPDAYPDCYTATDGTGTCITNLGDPATYPANWTANFGAFLSEEDNGTSCFTNVAGNPFEGPVNPFSLPGVTTQNFGDGVVRQVSTVCSIYQDPCDGSKSATCVKFISDASPLFGSFVECHVTCEAGEGSIDDGSVTLDLFGGSGDLTADGSGSFAGYAVTLGGMTPTSNTGNQFTWTGLAAGVYDLLVVDATAPACGSACDVVGTAVILPAPVNTLTAVDATGACDATMAVGTLSGESVTTISNGVVTIEEDFGGDLSGIQLDGQAGDCVGGGGATFNAAAFDLSTFFAGCTDELITKIAPLEVCFSTLAQSGTTSGLQGMYGILFAPDGSSIELFSGGCYTGGVGTCPSGGVQGDNICFTLGGTGTWPGDVGTGTFDSNDAATTLTGSPLGVWALGIGNLDCNYGDTPSYLIDMSITFNDFSCTTTSNIIDFSACAGAGHNGVAGAADGLVTLVPAAAPVAPAVAGPAGAATYNATTGEVTFVDPAPLSPGDCAATYCYDASAFLPGGKFNLALAGDASCINGECCEVTDQICFTMTASPLVTITTPGCDVGGMAGGNVTVTVTSCAGVTVTNSTNLTGVGATLPNGASTFAPIAMGSATIDVTDAATGCTANASQDVSGCVPAELIAFKGEARGNVNELAWETASEINTASFAVERSIDGKVFQELGRVAAAGNSVAALTYAFTDVKPLVISYYRLRTIDLDGTYEYSNIITINRKENRKGIVEVFPIPTDNDVTVQYEVATNTDVTFTLTDVLGRIVSQETVQANQGLNYYSVDMTTRATGLYFVTFSDGTIEQTRRVIKN